MNDFCITDSAGVPYVFLDETRAPSFDRLVARLAVLNPAANASTALRWWLGKGDALPLIERFNLRRADVLNAPDIAALHALLDALGVS